MTGKIESAEVTGQRPQRHLARPKKFAIIAALAVIALVLAFPVANWASDPATHASTIQSLDAKAKDVMAMTASSAAASAGIAAIPGGFGSTIATKLIDVTSGFAVVLGALYLEKYLLTILCLAALRVAAPIAAVIGAIAVAFWEDERRRALAGGIALKLALVALAMLLVIPTSTFVSNLIQDTYDASSRVATAAVEEQTSSEPETGGAEQAQPDATSGDEQSGDTESNDIIQQMLAAASGAADEVKKAATGAAETVTQGAQDIVSDAEAALNQMIEKMVIMIVVDCVIPILVVVFYIWLVNLLLGTSFKLSKLPVGKATSSLKSAVSTREEDRK